MMKLDYVEGMEFLQYMIKNANSVQIINNIINSFNVLLRSISLLVNKKIVHYDLKGSNILYSTKKNIPLIIDFGLSIDMSSINNKSLKEVFYTYAPQYYVWPLEVHYLGLLFNVDKEPSEEALSNLAKEYVKNNKGNVVKVNFGQGGDAKGGTMRIRKSNPAARKSFRARHNCDNPGPKYKARYWACRTW